MAPLFCFSMRRATARVQLNVPVRFTLSTRSHCSSDMRSRSESSVMPALFTRISRPPKAVWTFFTVVVAASESTTLHWNTSARRPSSRIAGATSCSAPSVNRSQRARSAPSRASLREIAAPMPREAPVTRAIFPSSCKLVSSLPHESEATQRTSCRSMRQRDRRPPSPPGTSCPVRCRLGRRGGSSSPSPRAPCPGRLPQRS